TLGVSVITVVMPVWYQAMSTAEKNKFFNKLKFKVLATASKILLGFGFDDILIAYIGEGYEQFEGKTVHQIAKEIGKSDLDTYIYLCDISNNAGRVNMSPYSTPAILTSLAKHPNVLYMTDSWVEDHGVQNQAIYDCFPKFLKFSLDGLSDTMENTIRKMTGAVADRFMLKNRGYIKEGYFADLTIFDENDIKNGVPDQNVAYGIEKVFVNGKLILNDNQIDNVAFSKSGKAMRVL
ncbi:MAG: hypothetical protein RR327_08465, partial [Clostridia bacterium]